jgi:hypothetical protein
MKEKIGCGLKEAMVLWEEALGGPAGKDSGHNLAFTEVKFAGKTQYCFKEFYPNYWNGKRNKFVSNDVLAIYWKDTASSGGVSSASLGYMPKEHADPSLGGFRHSMNIAENVPAAIIAHEVRLVQFLSRPALKNCRSDMVSDFVGSFYCSKSYADTHSARTRARDETPRSWVTTPAVLHEC